MEETQEKWSGVWNAPVGASDASVEAYLNSIAVDSSTTVVVDGVWNVY